MSLTLKCKTILAASISLLMMACNNRSEKINVQEVTLQDVKQEEADQEPPPPPPPGVEMKAADRKCFVNEGLKYKTTVSMTIGGKDVLGNVSSQNLENGETEVVEFEGNLTGEQLRIRFKGKAPVVGDATEWTRKSWKLETAGAGKEKLHILFNAKNYDSNKWEATDYVFQPADCQ